MPRSRIVKRYRQYEVPSDLRENGRNGTNGSGGSLETLVAEAIEHAQAVEMEAVEKAEQIVAEALMRAERIRETAQEAGYREGYARGLMEGAQATEAAAADGLAEIRRLVEVIRQERLEAVKNEEKALVLIALEAAGKILRQQVRADEAAVGKMIEEILFENEGVLRIILSEYQKTLDLHLDRQIARKIRQHGKGLKTIFVRDADTIMLETESGIVDESIPTQLEQLRQTIGHES